jgi:transcriptional regulator with XRE-family HTH domain
LHRIPAVGAAVASTLEDFVSFMADVFQPPSTPAKDGGAASLPHPDFVVESVGPVTPAPITGPRLTLDPSWSAGRKLSEARAQRGWSLDEAFARTKIRPVYLEAIEAMDAKILPGRAYTIAYLRNYCRALGVPEDELIAQYQAESALSREDARPQIRGPESRPSRERPWLAAAILGLVAGGFVMWRALGPEAASLTPAEERFTLDPSLAAQPSPEALALRTLEIRALAEAKLEVRGADGTVFFYGTLRPGQAYRPDPAPDWTIHARDGGAFSLAIQGQDVGLLGEAGKPVLGRLVSSIPLPAPLGQVAAGSAPSDAPQLR